MPKNVRGSDLIRRGLSVSVVRVSFGCRSLIELALYS